MNRRELFSMLKTLDIPVVYEKWTPDTAPKPPYICYRFASNDGSLQADNVNFYVVNEWYVELYTKQKDDDLEESLEALFYSNEIPFEKTEVTIEGDYHQVLYRFQTF